MLATGSGATKPAESARRDGPWMAPREKSLWRRLARAALRSCRSRRRDSLRTDRSIWHGPNRIAGEHDAPAIAASARTVRRQSGMPHWGQARSPCEHGPLAFFRGLCSSIPGSWAGAPDSGNAGEVEQRRAKADRPCTPRRRRCGPHPRRPGDAAVPAGPDVAAGEAARRRNGRPHRQATLPGLAADRTPPPYSRLGVEAVELLLQALLRALPRVDCAVHRGMGRRRPCGSWWRRSGRPLPHSEEVEAVAVLAGDRPGHGGGAGLVDLALRKSKPGPSLAACGPCSGGWEDRAGRWQAVVHPCGRRSPWPCVRAAAGSTARGRGGDSRRSASSANSAVRLRAPHRSPFARACSLQAMRLISHALFRRASKRSPRMHLIQS